MNKILWLSLFFTFISAHSFAQTYYSIDDIPKPDIANYEYVSDPENHISQYDESQINEIVNELKDKKGFEIAVVVVNSINGVAVLPFATDLLNLWGVGVGDRGILILVAVADRNMAFATGYATEEYIPDLVTKEISTEEMTPYFKLEDYSQGVLNGVETVRNIILDENVPPYVADLKELEKNRSFWGLYALIMIGLLVVLTIIVSPSKDTFISNGIGLLAAFIIGVVGYFVFLKEDHTKTIIWSIFSVLAFVIITINGFRILKNETKKIWPYAAFMTLVVPVPLLGFYFYDYKAILVVYAVGAGIVFGIFILLFTISLFQKDTYKKYHTVKVYRLDIFSYVFPLPMYVVDMWVENILDKWRNQVRFSTKTGLEMRKLSEEEDDAYLEKGQVTEEQVKSVDYDVWITDEPGDILILKYSPWYSKYNTCSKCKYKTWYLVYDKTISSATYSSSGTGEKKKACAHCGHQDITRYTIPRLERASSGGSYSSSGGGYSGGSGGGGSFGGGSSGGGGSSSSW